MSGTYNEVQVKKLGQKANRPRQNRPRKSKDSPVQHQNPGPSSGSSTLSHQYGNNPHNPAQKSPKNTQHAPSADAAWPPALQGFVNRSFERAESLPEAAKAAFNEQIQSLIYTAAREQKVWTNDWEQQRLPVFDPSSPLALYQDTAEAQHRTQSGPNATLSAAQYDSRERKKRRMERFQGSASPSPGPSSKLPPKPPSGTDSKQIIGTSTALEKRYLRLTSEPDPSMVRPKHVLKECLPHVVEKYRTTGASYSYINDQLKAIRQDLTVQHIKGSLAVEVYETHGRIAIENNDLGEFNQCQAQLKHLYAENTDPQYYKHTYEFCCYRILYLLLTGNYADINLIRLELLDKDPATESTLSGDFKTRRKCVYRALELADYVTLGDFHGVFRLYKWYRSLGCMDGAFHLIDQFMANKQRVLALNTMSKAFKILPLSHVREQLALKKNSQFFAEFGLQEHISGSDFDCAKARWALQAIVDKGTFKKIDIKGQV